MTKQDFLTYCLEVYGTKADYPFDEDFETAVLRHSDNRKWYALVMRVSRRKFGIQSNEVIDVINLKMPLEMCGSFGKSDAGHRVRRAWRIYRDAYSYNHTHSNARTKSTYSN